MARDLAKEERICLRLEEGIPAWVIGNEEDMSTPMILHIYRRHRGVNWITVREKYLGVRVKGAK